MGFLALNSLYPSVLFLFPPTRWVRLGAAGMDAVLDLAYTVTYLIITLLAIHELRLDQTIQGNFGDVEAVNFKVELSADFAFPTDFLGFFAVYYSVAHVCAVCRAMERILMKSPPGSFRSTSLALPASAKNCLKRASQGAYSMALLLVVGLLLLSPDHYPGHTGDYGCFPCSCSAEAGAKSLERCGPAVSLRIRDLSLSDRNISSIAGDAFRPFGCRLRRLSLSGNPLGTLPPHVFAPLGCLELLDLGRAELRRVEEDALAGLSSLQIWSLIQIKLTELPAAFLRPMPALEQLLLGGK